MGVELCHLSLVDKRVSSGVFSDKRVSLGSENSLDFLRSNDSENVGIGQLGSGESVSLLG